MKIRRNILFLCTLCIAGLSLSGCSIQQRVKRADKKFAIGEYYEAADIYKSCYSRLSTKKDRELYRRWTDEWGFDEGMLILAAEQAREAEQPLPYINKILQTWHEEGVKEPGQAAKKRTRPTAGRQVSAQQYTQRDYSEEELERRAVNLLEEASKENE